MKIELLAHTMINHGTLDKYMSDVSGIDWISSDADLVAEFAGRSCYQSFHKPNPKTAANHDYLKNILNQGHYSVLEHASATFYVSGVSRALTHELIRHRHLSYSELSQRFVDISEADLAVPPALRDMETKGEGPESVYEAWHDAMNSAGDAYEAIVQTLIERGYARKQAREAARAVMPNATETRIVVTGNHRAWRDMLYKRYSTHADAEIREFAAEILRQLKKVAPGHFQDFPSEPFGSDE